MLGGDLLTKVFRAPTEAFVLKPLVLGKDCECHVRNLLNSCRIKLLNLNILTVQTEDFLQQGYS